MESARRDESNGTIFSPIGEGRLFGDPTTGVCAQIVVQTRVIAKNVPDETQNFFKNFFFEVFDLDRPQLRFLSAKIPKKFRSLASLARGRF